MFRLVFEARPLIRSRARPSDPVFSAHSPRSRRLCGAATCLFRHLRRDSRAPL